ncbi:MAG: response regulator [Thermodesulfobacteriota bacterium]
MKVLVVEDNPSNMKLVARLLTGAGHEVLKAEEAEGGIRLAQDESPDLILLDMQLPGMDGLSAVARLREDERTKDIKVVALTAFAMDGDRERFLQAGCDEYMSKPIGYKEFLKMIDSFKAGSKDE